MPVWQTCRKVLLRLVVGLFLGTKYSACILSYSVAKKTIHLTAAKTYGDKLVATQNGGLGKSAAFKDKKMVRSMCEGQGMLNINLSVILSSSAASAEDIEEDEGVEAKDVTVSVSGFGRNLAWRPSQY